MNLGNINTEEIREKGALVDKGWYTAQISDQQDKATKKGGTQLVLEYLICDNSDFNGSTVKESYNIICPTSAKAEEIARREIGLVGKHCGIANLRDSEDLLGKILEIYVDIREPEGDYPAKNIVTNTRKHEESSPAPAPAKATASAPASAPEQKDNLPPWMRNKG